jgi:hypothetical protein
MQESTYPTFGDEDTYPSPSGMAAGSTGPGDVTVVAYRTAVGDVEDTADVDDTADVEDTADVDDTADVEDTAPVD